VLISDRILGVCRACSSLIIGHLHSHVLYALKPPRRVFLFRDPPPLITIMPYHSRAAYPSRSTRRNAAHSPEPDDDTFADEETVSQPDSDAESVATRRAPYGGRGMEQDWTDSDVEGMEMLGRGEGEESGEGEDEGDEVDYVEEGEYGDDDQDDEIASRSTEATKSPPQPLHGLKEIGNLASWTVSTAKPGCGVEQLRDEDTNLYWQSDGPQPHHINIHFAKRVKVKRIRMYLDFENDESYTPTKMSVLSGTGFQDLVEVTKLDLERPTGWIEVRLDDVHQDGELRTFLIQVAIHANHQNGKDTHVRGLQIFAAEPYCSPLLHTIAYLADCQGQGPPSNAARFPSLARPCCKSSKCVRLAIFSLEFRRAAGAGMCFTTIHLHASTR
jgi:anaphase-promoting complex subunit 10